MLNVSFLVSDMKKSFGGTAGNIAYNLSLLDIKTGILACVGSDFEPYREFLEEHDVDIRFVKSVNSFFTSQAFGITDTNNNQIWGFYTGADSLTENLSTKQVKGTIDFGVVAPNNPIAMIKFCKEYTDNGIPYLFDPGMQLPHLSRADLLTGVKGAKIIIANDYEMSSLLHKVDYPRVSSFGKDKIVIITKGREGSIVYYKDEEYDIPVAKPKSTIDPAGAGDAYRAGFLAGYLRDFSLPVCGRMGSVSAVYTVEKAGTTSHEFTTDLFMKRYKENFGQTLEL